MSCQINKIAHLSDVAGIKAELLKDDSIRCENVPSEELPLQECSISLSSAGDILVLALHRRLIVLTSKWDLQEFEEVKNKFHIIWSGYLTSEPNDYITSVICLPLAILGKSSSRAAVDWTCIVVGFNNGFIRFYTECADLLYEKQFHNESILSIKSQSLNKPKNAGESGLCEEIYVLYNSVVCIISGSSLFSILRASRNHLARVQAHCDTYDKYMMDKTIGPWTVLNFKKLAFKDQDLVNDCESIGITSVNTFDHLMTASICGGYNASYRSSAPQHNLIMAIGKRPFIGFHYVLEGSTAPVLSEVAIAMASTLATAIGKIGTAVPWLRNSSSKSNPPTGSNNNVNNNGNNSGNSNASIGQQDGKVRGYPMNEPPEAMTCRFALSDIMRQGYTLVNSPNKNLSVVSDSMGRVILINNKKGIALRMWKGYRDAQCGWIETIEDGNLPTNRLHGSQKKQSNVQKTPLKTALYLIIYAPKKGIIDIWGIQHGARITTFTACKNGRLIYINYGLFGLNNVVPMKANKPMYSCIFMDSLGSLKEITVPFHFALSSKDGKRARDIHLFKKLKTFMRAEEFDNEKLLIQVKNICEELKTNEIRMEIILMLMSNKQTTSDALLCAVDCFISDFDKCSKEEIVTSADDTFYLTISQLQNIIKFYKYAKELYDRSKDSITKPTDDPPNVDDLTEILCTSSNEIDRILKLWENTYEKQPDQLTKHRHKITFQHIHGDSLFLIFMSSFEFGIKGSIKLITDINEDNKLQIASLLYHGWMYSTNEKDNVAWKEIANASDIHPKSMMELALTYWLNKSTGSTDVSLEIELIKFTQLLQTICSLCEDSEVLTWWPDIRYILMHSTKPIEALTAAVVCRSVAIHLEKLKEHDAAIGSNGNKWNQEDWENMTDDTCKFTLLIGNLEDVSILNSILHQPPPSDNGTSHFSLPYEKLVISMSHLVAQGKGSVTEIVAKWLSTSGIDPQCLITLTDIEFVDNKSNSDSHNPTNDDEIPEGKIIIHYNDDLAAEGSIESSNSDVSNSSARQQILDKMSILKCHYPYSLSSSTLLANLCWEFVIYWSKQMTELQSLQAALNILDKIPSKPIRHGVCSLLWTIHIKKRMEVAAKLINKLGKLPKERLTIQELGLSDVQVTIFLQECSRFLDIFLDCQIMADGNAVIIKSEELWEGYNTGPQAFVALALAQKPAAFDLIMLHFQLANVLHMIAHFNMKTSKPMSNFFNTSLNKYFFDDITDKIILPWNDDEKRDACRLEFICQVLALATRSIHQGTPMDDINAIIKSPGMSWIHKCQSLAALWKCNKDKLTIHQIYQLYINGFDRLAEELLNSVHNRESLGVHLLPIAGKRMMSYLSQAPNLLEELSKINPLLVRYLKNINIPSVMMTTNANTDTIELITKAFQCLPDNHKDYHIAQLMLDATFIYKRKTL